MELLREIGQGTKLLLINITQKVSLTNKLVADEHIKLIKHEP